MPDSRFPELTQDQMTDEQRAVVDAIQSGPRGAGLRGPFNALLRSPALCDLVQRVGAYVRFASSIPAPLNELAICMAGRKWGAPTATAPIGPAPWGRAAGIAGRTQRHPVACFAY